MRFFLIGLIVILALSWCIDGWEEKLKFFGCIGFFLCLYELVNFFNVFGLHIIFLFFEIGFEFFELRKGLILSLSHGIEPFGILVFNVIGLIFYTGGKVWDVFVFLLISSLYLKLFLDSFKLFFQFVERLFEGKYLIFKLPWLNLNQKNRFRNLG